MSRLGNPLQSEAAAFRWLLVITAVIAVLVGIALALGA
jgi:hypothetical protein